MYKLAWAGLADLNYWNAIAKYCVPSWTKLPGDKFIIHDANDLNIINIKTIPWNVVYNCEAKFLKLTNRLKPLNFWRKMQSQVYSIRNLKNYDFVILLDTDIEILDFDLEKFNKELESLKNSNFIWATGQSNRGGHDSGFIVLNVSHPQLKELTDYYENIWESGDIFKLDKWYDGHAVESMFDRYPSYKIKNKDYGSGLHVYDLGLVHYGSKIPKQLRADWVGDGKSLVEKRLSEIPIKTYKSDKI
jgi:hypothetical protein